MSCFWAFLQNNENLRYTIRETTNCQYGEKKPQKASQKHIAL